MAQSFDDLNLPLSSIMKIAKEALPDNVAVAKEARIALGKSASIFILYITSASFSVARMNNRRTINASDVIRALEETDFIMFKNQLEADLETFKNHQQEKKSAAVQRKKEKDGKAASSTEAPESHDTDDQEDPIETEEVEDELVVEFD